MAYETYSTSTNTCAIYPMSGDVGDPEEIFPSLVVEGESENWPNPVHVVGESIGSPQESGI
ncbi:MAG: hypothetical protein KDD67_04295 [Ignavibacteriae bacterium]|nr:hypothetical protein [Ignavibacteriota bacterium]MCB9217047.1 hypothetical protein [Ignavibacteria bacterium]